MWNVKGGILLLGLLTLLSACADDGIEKLLLELEGSGLYGGQGTATGRLTGSLSHSLVLRSDGTLWAMGGNTWGQLGIGGTGSVSVPTPVDGGSPGWKKVDTYQSASIGLKENGTVWTWGYPDPGLAGGGSDLPGQESSGATNWVDISADKSSAGALTSIATLYSVGWGYGGMLGLGDTADRSAFTLTGITSVRNFSLGGYHSGAITTNGAIWLWGTGVNDQLCNLGTADILIPTQTGPGSNWLKVITDPSGKVTMALKTDGTLWGCGYNGYHTLGTGNANQLNVWQQEATAATDWLDFTIGEYHVLALKRNHTLWAWGFNNQGQVGTGSCCTNVPTPVQIGTDSDWVSIGAGWEHSLAIKSNGTLWAWGMNDNGRLGLGDTVNRSAPTLVGSGW